MSVRWCLPLIPTRRTSGRVFTSGNRRSASRTLPVAVAERVRSRRQYHLPARRIPMRPVTRTPAASLKLQRSIESRWQHIARRCMGAELLQRIDPQDAVAEALLRLLLRSPNSPIDRCHDVPREIRRVVIDAARKLAADRRHETAYETRRQETRRQELRELCGSLSTNQGDRVILRLLARRNTIGEVARRLGRTPGSIRSRLSRLRRRLAVNS